MSPETYAWVGRLHGYVSLLGLAVLMHPILTLRQRKVLTPWMLRTADLGALLLAVPFGVGWAIYPTYRAEVKPPLWLVSPGAVLRFESKEHLAAMAVALAIGGALTLRLSGRHPAGREAAWMQLLCGWALAMVTAFLGLYVSGAAHPGW